MRGAGAGARGEAAEILSIVDEVAHLLPQQAPIHTFVHHNTLHAFEHLPFEQAVIEGAKLYGTQPFLSEDAFAAHIQRGRILPSDLDAVVVADASRRGGDDVAVVGRLTRNGYRALRLRYLFEIPRGRALDWQLLETQLLSEYHPSVDAFRRRELQARADRRYGGLAPSRRASQMLNDLWQDLVAVAPVLTEDVGSGPRRRDQFLRIGVEDLDQRVHPLLIRLAAAYLDQGVSSWAMPFRELGFLGAVRRLYGQPLQSPESWMSGLDVELRRQHDSGMGAVETVRDALVALGIRPDQWHEQIQATLLSLRGWAGMMRQFEERPDRAPVEPRPARLVDFLAVQLTFDQLAAQHALCERFGRGASWAQLESAMPAPRVGCDQELVYEAFVMAQIAHVDVDALKDRAVAARWIEEVRAFGEIDRRRLLHLAFERRLRTTALDGLAAHCELPGESKQAPTLQAIFCIDERECSTRRHLEETLPGAQTYGFAGFFGVAMAWQGLGEVRSRPLCPVNVTPKHYVTERALDPQEEQAWRIARRRRGLTTQALQHGSRTVARGGLLSTFLGLWSVVPMILRCLFPGMSERLQKQMRDPAGEEPVTQLLLERTGDERNSDGLFVGFSVPEMADVVENALRTIGLVDNFCEIVLLIGHGSSSLNNPHESAYDCGATGGGRGGPNARAFAQMANHPKVRETLAGRGIRIPDTTWFVGTLHNTCNDSIQYFDEDLMPEARQAALEKIKRTMATVCELQAHERCRRFVSAPKDADAATALRHVVGRSLDLAQPRPECGHATNAYAIIGRRSRTRGLFLDRRAFLISYDPTIDADGAILTRLLNAVVPVGSGINLEYYFSFVDSLGYGCGSKLPHNITSLIGIMDGHSSDLRTGLPWQMVEIHEPVRLLCVVDVEPEVARKFMQQSPAIAQFIANGWIQLVVWSPSTNEIWHFTDGDLRRYEPESSVLSVVPSSESFYRGQIDHLGCARVQAPGMQGGMTA